MNLRRSTLAGGIDAHLLVQGQLRLADVAGLVFCEVAGVVRRQVQQRVHASAADAHRQRRAQGRHEHAPHCSDVSLRLALPHQAGA